MTELITFKMRLKHRVLLKKARLLIEKDCDHKVGGQEAGTMCACAALRYMGDLKNA